MTVYHHTDIDNDAVGPGRIGPMAQTSGWDVDAIEGAALAAQLGPGPQLRDMAVGDRFVADSIGLTLRGPDWETILPEPVASSVAWEGNSATLRSEWVATAPGSGAVLRARFDVDWAFDSRDVLIVTTAITADRTCRLGRAGIVAWHPVELLGHRLRARTSGGEWTGRLPEAVTPQPPLPNFTGLRFDLDGGSWIDLDFHGTETELEDHRNWTDAGWKSYSPPLAVGSVALAAHVATVQTMTVTARRDRRRARHRSNRGSNTGSNKGSNKGSNTVRVEWSGIRRRAPRLGCGVAMTPVSAEAGIRPSFLHAEVTEPAALLGILAQAEHLQVPVWLMVITDDASLPDWAARIRSAAHLVQRVCFIRSGQLDGDPVMLSRARGLLAGLRGLRLGGGTRGYLAELGRATTPADVDYVQVSVSAQVHSGEGERMMDTTRAHRFVVPTMAAAVPGSEYVVAPVTLAQRMSMHRADQGEPTGEDPRAAGPFGAAWLLSSVVGLADADAVSYFRLGPGGGLVNDGVPTPAGRLLDQLCRLGLWELEKGECDDPRRVVAARLHGPAGTSRLLANLTGQPVTVVDDHGLPGGTPRSSVVLAAYQVDEHREPKGRRPLSP